MNSRSLWGIAAEINTHMIAALMKTLGASKPNCKPSSTAAPTTSVFEGLRSIVGADIIEFSAPAMNDF